MGYQLLTLLGNVGSEPTLKYLSSGVAVCEFSVAYNETWTVDGEKREKVIWHRVSAWGKLAEVCNQYVVKGKQVMVVGTVEARAYLDKQNQPASSLDLRARDVRFLGSGANAGDGNNREPDNEVPF
jgi:single-strand DNA-binding protein